MRTAVLILLFTLLLLGGCRQSGDDSAPTSGVGVRRDPTATPITESYPVATAAWPVTITPVTPYPAAPPSPSKTPPPESTAPDPPPANYSAYLPLINDAPLPTPTAVPTLPAAPELVPPPTPYPTVDFTAVRADLSAQGQQLVPVKIGFHVGVGGNADGLDTWMRRLDEAGIPFFLKSVDNAGPILFAQELMRQSGVPHVLVYRRSTGGDYDWDVPNYNLPPAEAARIHWEQHIERFPPELDPALVWLETINEVDKNRAEWLGQFALATADLAMAQGYRWAAFGWASGEPETEHWQTPSMLQFLRLAGQNPDRLAIALHEYSYELENIAAEYPFKLGRFQELLRVVDDAGIPRPTILITEWGWTYQKVPAPNQALEDISWAADLYAAYPEVKGAAIWYLGPGFARIADQTQRLIAPVTRFSLQNYYTAPAPPAVVPVQPELYQP